MQKRQNCPADWTPTIPAGEAPALHTRKRKRIRYQDFPLPLDFPLEFMVDCLPRPCARPRPSPRAEVAAGSVLPLPLLLPGFFPFDFPLLDAPFPFPLIFESVLFFPFLLDAPRLAAGAEPLFCFSWTIGARGMSSIVALSMVSLEFLWPLDFCKKSWKLLWSTSAGGIPAAFSTAAFSAARCFSLDFSIFAAPEALWVTIFWKMLMARRRTSSVSGEKGPAEGAATRRRT